MGKPDFNEHRGPGHPVPERANGIFTEEELEFIKAVEQFQKVNKVRFLKHTDYLVIVGKLGYKKQ